MAPAVIVTGIVLVAGGIALTRVAPTLRLSFVGFGGFALGIVALVAGVVMAIFDL